MKSNSNLARWPHLFLCDPPARRRWRVYAFNILVSLVLCCLIPSLARAGMGTNFIWDSSGAMDIKGMAWWDWDGKKIKERFSSPWLKPASDFSPNVNVLTNGLSFDIWRLFGTGADNTYSVAVGDMNGDGHLDLVVGNIGQNVVYLNDGAGNFDWNGAVHHFGTVSEDTRSVAVGDVNGDGHLDLIVGNVGPNAIYLNDGAGNFDWDGAAHRFGPDSDRTFSVAAGDIDGDGDLDLIVGNGSQQSAIYLNNEVENFYTGPINCSATDSIHCFGPDSDWTESLAVGDVDGDGMLDLVVGARGLVYLNNGQGYFYTGSVDDCTTAPDNVRCFGPDSNDVTSVAVADVNSDGVLDIVVGSWQQQNAIYLNDGKGYFDTGLVDCAALLGHVRCFGSESSPTYSIAVGDVSGDGALDLVAGNKGEQNVVYLNDGIGHFDWPDAAHDFGSPSTIDIPSFAIGDVNNDGNLDLVVGHANNLWFNRQNLVYLNNGAGSFPTSGARHFGPEDALDQTEDVAVGDVNDDGHLDLIVGNSGWDAVYLNDGAGNFDRVGAVHNIGSDADSTRSIAVGDVDGDGDLDLVVGKIGQNMVYLNDGSGNFPIAHHFGPDYGVTYSLVVGDVDGDGDLDIVEKEVYLNDGAGNFSWGSELGTGLDWGNSVAVGDLNGDNDLDVIVGNLQGQNTVYLNDGTGHFDWDGAARYFGTGLDDTKSVAAGDVNGDGALDLVAGNNGQNRICLNDGKGNFNWAGAVRYFGTSVDDTNSVAVGDVNGDGHLDIITGNSSGQNIAYLNDGAGHFSHEAARAFGTGYDGTTSVAVGDLNGDGTLDLVTGNTYLSSGEQNVVYLNRYRLADRLANNAPYLTVTRPVTTANAGLYSSPIILDSTVISITYTLFDPDGDPVGRIAAYYSLDGGGRWHTATAADSTITTNLTTGRMAYYAGHTDLPRPIPDQNTISTTLVITEAYEMADIDVLLFITHTYDADLEIYLQSPTGTLVELFSDVGTDGDHFDHTLLSDQASIAITSGSAPFTGIYRPEGSLATFNGEMSNGIWTLIVTDDTEEDTGTLVAWGLQIKTPPALHTFAWDTFASGFFGQSDNVLFRLEAYPQPAGAGIAGAYRYTNTVAGPRQWPYASATTFPFRVRGTQVRVSDTAPISNALVYRLPEGHLTGGSPFADGSGVPFRTDRQGYLQGRGQIGIGDRLLAMAPVHTDLSYAGAIEFDGVDDYVIKESLNNAPITATTVSFWMRSDDTTGSGTPLSYATSDDDDELLITNYNNLTIYRGESSVTTGITATDGVWHHIAVAWCYSDGQVKLYKDGAAAFTGTLTTTSITTGGSLVLGQDQDSVGGGFDPGQAFEGDLDEVRVWNTVLTEAQILDDMFGASSGEGAHLTLYWNFDDPDTASSGRCKDRSANGNDATLRGATWDGDFLGGYTVYHTNGEPTEDGIDAFTVTEPGVQVLSVTAEHPLILFDIDVSLEWDAISDPTYLDQLTFDLKKASRHLYDFTDGQVALGHVTVHQNEDHWASSHVAVQATNRLRPLAAQGGIVLTPTVDPQHEDIIYESGQVRMGATWNRYGDPGFSIGGDWPLALAHELSHYFLFLDDVYLGLNEEGLLIPSDTCTGSAMGDMYAPDNTEFIYDPNHWYTSCADTLANRTLGRTEWETIHLWYPWLISPTITNPGPGLMPFELTTVDVLDPVTPTEALVDPTFYVDYEGGKVSSSEARAFIMRDENINAEGYERVVDLGSPIGGQNRVLARGAQPGDRLCVFDQPRRQYGCEVIQTSDERLTLEQDEIWTPLLRLSPITSQTFTIQVSSLPTDTVRPPTLTLRARLYPEYGSGSEVITLTQVDAAYSGTFHLDSLAMMGHVQVWMDEAATETHPRRETIVAYTMGGDPGPFSRGHGPFSRGHGPFSRGHGPFSRGSSAPLVSPGGQMIFFTENPIVFEEGDLYTIHSMAGLPPLPEGKTAIGQGYMIASNITRVITGSISFQYLTQDVLLEKANEDELGIHFWNGQEWQALDTVCDAYYNMASAHSQGDGVYALLAGSTIPYVEDVSPSAATNDIKTELAIQGGYFLPPVEAALVGPTATYTLPLVSVSPTSITAEITQGLPAREYYVVVVNQNQAGGSVTSPTPGAFALYTPPPPDTCFYDFFESGASKWELGGNWGIVILPNGERVMTDSPDGPYKNAGDYGPGIITYTTCMTSIPFNLTGCQLPLLTLDHDYVIAGGETHQDVGRVEGSDYEGVTWKKLQGYTGGGVFGNRIPLSLLSPLDQETSEWEGVDWRTAEIGLSEFTDTVRLRFCLEADRNVSDRGWVMNNVMVREGSILTTDLQIDLVREGSGEVQAGDPITYNLTITNAGPDRLDALATSLFPFGGVASIEGSAPCWANRNEALFCSFDELTRTQTLTMVLNTWHFYSGTLSTQATITAAYPYAVETDPDNNQGYVQVSVRGPVGLAYLPVILRGE